MSCVTTPPQAMTLRLLDEAGPFLTGRSIAASLRARLEAEAVDHQVVVDLEGVEVVSPSFADEFFGKLPPDLVERGSVTFIHLTPELLAIADLMAANRARQENGS
jgi:hypothetical protein